MASCICHVVCAPMWRRLERLVRPLLPGTRAELAAAQLPNRNTTTTWRSWAVPGTTKRELQLARAKSLTRICPKPTRRVESCGRSRLSEAEVSQAILPMPITARAKRQEWQMSDEPYATEKL